MYIEILWLDIEYTSNSEISPMNNSIPFEMLINVFIFW